MSRKLIVRICACVLAAFLAVIVLRMISGALVKDKELHDDIANGLVQDVTMPDILARRGWKRDGLSISSTKRITHAESNEVERAIADVVKAYANGQESVMQERIAMIPKFLPVVENVSYSNLMSPIWGLADEFWRGDSSMTFNSVNELDSYLCLNSALMRFVGDLDSKRHPLSGYSMVVETETMIRLHEFRARFENVGQNDFVKCVNKYINDWIEHVESEDGYIRRYAWFQVSLQYDHIKDRSWTYGQLFRWARFHASGIIRKCNYRPKWLDEDFPLPEGTKDMWDK